MPIIQYCYNTLSQKNYCQIFSQNFALGWKIGATTVIANSITPVNIISYPYLNRAIEIGGFHLIQESFGSMEPTNYSELIHNLNTTNIVTSPAGRGMAQTNKYIANTWVQNNLKHSFSDLGKSLNPNLETFIKGTFTPAYGMTVFFVIGEIEKKITDPISKLYYAGTLFAGITTIAYQNCIPGESHIDKVTGSALFTFKDTALISAGLATSFAIFDGVKTIYRSTKNNLEEYIETYNNEITNIYKKATNNIKELPTTITLTGTAFSIIATEFYLGKTQAAILHAGTIISFSFAKATGVTFVEIANDYIDFVGILSIEDFGTDYFHNM